MGKLDENERLREAKKVFVYYFEEVYTATGRDWTFDNTAEIECAVEDIYDAAVNDVMREVRDGGKR